MRWRITSPKIDKKREPLSFLFGPGIVVQQATSQLAALKKYRWINMTQPHADIGSRNADAPSVVDMIKKKIEGTSTSFLKMFAQPCRLHSVLGSLLGPFSYARITSWIALLVLQTLSALDKLIASRLLAQRPCDPAAYMGIMRLVWLLLETDTSKKGNEEIPKQARAFLAS